MNKLRKIRSRIANIFLNQDYFSYLKEMVIELNNVNELKKVFKWNEQPIIDDSRIYEFEHVEDVNERRIRDAEVLATTVCNINPSACLEIGTARGHGTALIASNAPQAKVYTINIDPEEIKSGGGGKATTEAFTIEEIGLYYRQKGCSNVTQIIANTAKWNPDIGFIDFAFVDGCHDTTFVINDTKKVLKLLQPGSFIVWHDFNLGLVNNYHWINSVCLGVESLARNGYLKNRIFHVKDSWMGVYQV